MARNTYTAEQIITKLREAEIELAKGQTTTQVCNKLGISDQTYYRCRLDRRTPTTWSFRATHRESRGRTDSTGSRARTFCRAASSINALRRVPRCCAGTGRVSRITAKTASPAPPTAPANRTDHCMTGIAAATGTAATRWAARMRAAQAAGGLALRRDVSPHRPRRRSSTTLRFRRPLRRSSTWCARLRHTSAVGEGTRRARNDRSPARSLDTFDDRLLIAARPGASTLSLWRCRLRRRTRGEGSRIQVRPVNGRDIRRSPP